ncbi:Uncharacterized protein QTN25_003634 [Entamoeba marina]
MSSECQVEKIYEKDIDNCTNFLRNQHTTPLTILLPQQSNNTNPLTTVSSRLKTSTLYNLKLYEEYGYITNDDAKAFVSYLIKFYKTNCSGEGDNVLKILFSLIFNQFSYEMTREDSSKTEDLLATCFLCLTPHLPITILNKLLKRIKRRHNILGRLFSFIIRYNFNDTFDVDEYEMPQEQVKELKIFASSWVFDALEHGIQGINFDFAYQTIKWTQKNNRECPIEVNKALKPFHDIQFDSIGENVEKLLHKTQHLHFYLFNHQVVLKRSSENVENEVRVNSDFVDLMKKENEQFKTFCVCLPYSFYKEGLSLDISYVAKMFTTSPFFPLLLQNKYELIEETETLQNNDKKLPKNIQIMGRKHICVSTNNGIIESSLTDFTSIITFFSLFSSRLQTSVHFVKLLQGPLRNYNSTLPILLDGIEEYFIFRAKKGDFLFNDSQLLNELRNFKPEVVFTSARPFLACALLCDEMRLEINAASKGNLSLYPVDAAQKVAELDLNDDLKRLFLHLIVSYWVYLEQSGSLSNYRIRLELFKYGHIRDLNLLGMLATENTPHKTITDAYYKIFEILPSQTFSNDPNVAPPALNSALQLLRNDSPHVIHSNVVKFCEGHIYFFQTPSEDTKSSTQPKQVIANSASFNDILDWFGQNGKFSKFYEQKMSIPRSGAWDECIFAASYCIPKATDNRIRETERCFLSQLSEYTPNVTPTFFNDALSFSNQLDEPHSKLNELSQMVLSRFDAFSVFLNLPYHHNFSVFSTTEFTRTFITCSLISRSCHKHCPFTRQDLFDIQLCLSSDDFNAFLSALCRLHYTSYSYYDVLQAALTLPFPFAKQIICAAAPYSNITEALNFTTPTTQLLRDTLSESHNIEISNAILRRLLILTELRGEYVNHLLIETNISDIAEKIDLKTFLKEIPTDKILDFCEKISNHVLDTTCKFYLHFLLQLCGKSPQRIMLTSSEFNKDLNQNELSQYGNAMSIAFENELLTVRVQSLNFIEYIVKWDEIHLYYDKFKELLLTCFPVLKPNNSLNTLYVNFVTENDPTFSKQNKRLFGFW